ncbi:MAG: pyridoxal phosphate-dependent aminotransferase [Calditrichaeota bacterium]|nr:MAG: pyridoxal phosphate-dependent aminotransferase [Calditrichota bacterium]
MKLARRVQRIQPSATLQVKEKALRLKREGRQVVDLTAGEPDFPTPAHICRAGEQAIREGFTRYTANVGIPELREAIVAKLARDNGLHFTPEQVIVCNGAKHALANAILAIVEEGDEVVIPAPYWVTYPQLVRLAGGRPHIIDTLADGGKLTAELLSANLAPSTAAVLLNSPANPTGVVYTEQELSWLAEVLADHSCWIISDEIYEKIIFDGLRHVSPAHFARLAARTVVINGVSKAYAMTGWRIGYAAGPKPLIQAMARIQSHTTSNASAISQRAALAALTGPEEPIEAMRRAFQQRRDFLVQQFTRDGRLRFVHPRGAFYLFVDISPLLGKMTPEGPLNAAADVATFLLNSEGLVVVPGEGFGAPSHVRISFAAGMDQLELGVGKLFRCVDQLLTSRP